ncbi:MAG: MerR family transcriptional regulator [Solirubrobacteraceae bacterium]
MSATTETAPLRIGEVARRVGTTPRTIRYYEEIGLLGDGGEREAGQHRTYSERDVDRLRDALRLKDLLGLSLDELKAIMEREEARGALRAELHADDTPQRRRRQILEEGLTLVERQLELARARRDELAALEAELADRRRRIRTRLKELDA